MKKTEKNLHGIFTVIAYIVVIVVVAVLFNRFFYAPMRVVGNSMNPTFQNGDVLLVSKLAYEKDNPKRFDLVVFSYQYDIHTWYIKRVIGMPGETIEIRDNKIYIEDEELQEYYGIYEQEKVFDDYGPYTLRSDEYFVLGDNREVSVDSRSGDVGPVKKEMFIGKASFRLWPFDAVGSLKYQ